MITVGDCNVFKPFNSKLFTRNQLVEMCELYTNKSLSVAELARRYRVKEGIVNYYIGKYLFYTKAEETKTILLHSKI